MPLVEIIIAPVTAFCIHGVFLSGVGRPAPQVYIYIYIFLKGVLRGMGVWGKGEIDNAPLKRIL
jgi:hypothetical protein